jgi:hypothetical protein
MKEDMTYAPADGELLSPIRPENIVYSRLPVPGAKDFDPMEAADVPGIVLSRTRYNLPPMEGTNREDDWHFQWRIQLIGQGTGDPTDGDDSFSLWQEQIADWFHYTRILDVLNGAGFDHNFTIASLEDDMEQKLWTKERFFAAAIVLTTVFRRRRRFGR